MLSEYSQWPFRCTLLWLWTRHFDGIQAGIPTCDAGYLYITTTFQVTGQTLVSYPFITHRKPSELDFQVNGFSL
ncbi:hypothetical protein HOLleu_31931 [Holothuria leucospilota]|uniref:Uncharacterized protein n=1 Tax=Holothuria leucospilota TaxID=206669 RepID=A0A9Q0YR36_HOLLE|nr:hypothetical protein HOLleu_31931 [Holothuria leucospilota]